MKVKEKNIAKQFDNLWKRSKNKNKQYLKIYLSQLSTYSHSGSRSCNF